MGIWDRKPVASLQDVSDGELHRHLGLTHLILIGIGGTIGAGIFVLTGTAAATYAGPAIALSFLIAGVGCLCAALCYAELASMIPASGSAYTYAYATLGELVAWIVGWSLVLEYLFAAATVAVGWSGYFVSYAAELGLEIPAALASPPLTWSVERGWTMTGGLINLPAVAIILALSMILRRGVRGSALSNALMVLLKVAVIVLVIGFGVAHVRPEHWTPFVPENTGRFGEFGWSGIVRAAGVVFFAYIGFDMVSTSAQEARNPKRDIPLGILISLGVCTALYIAMCLVLTGLVPYRALNVPQPVYVAISAAPALDWLKPVVAVGVLVGLASAMLVTLYGQSRIFYRMARDGLIPRAFGRIDPVHRVPALTTWVVGAAAALIAGVLPIGILGELVSLGTLLAFVIICIGVVVLRRADPDAPRGFRVPWLGPVAALGIGICLFMMISLPAGTWLRLAVWLAIGGAIYFFYGRRNSTLSSGPSLPALATPAARSNPEP